LNFYFFRDVFLLGAKVISNCNEPSSIYEHPYLCVIANFKPIDASDSPLNIEIEYEYTSENLLRRREKPFSSTEHENVIVWIYDNNKINSSIDLVNLNIKFENQIDIKKLIAYPEKFMIKNQPDVYINNSTTNVNNSITTISWTIKDIKPNSFKNFALNIPIFNTSCKGMVKIFIII